MPRDARLPRTGRWCLAEAASRCRTEEPRLRLWIEQGWILPVAPDELRVAPDAQRGPETGSVTEAWLDDEDLARAALIRELLDEMGVNDESVPIILHLIDQLHVLRRELRARLKAG
jgi:chaperone modulatory protein CbpM